MIVVAAGDRLIGNSAFLLIDWLAITVLSLAFWLVIGKTLPKEVYGIVATALNIIIILSGVALLGLQTAMIKLISEFKEKNQTGKIKSLVRFTIKVSFSVSLAFSVAIGLLSPVLSPILNLPVDVIVLAAVGIFVFSVWGVTTAVMYGFQSMKRIMKTNFAGNVVKVVSSLALILLGFSYFGPLVGLILSVIAIILFRLDVLWLAVGKLGDYKSSKLNFKSIFTYSTSAFVAAMAMVGFANTPNIILNALTGPAITGLFAISLTISSPIFSIPSVLSAALFPITSGLSAERGGRSRQKILINMVVRYASFITLPIIALLLVFSGTIILFFSSGDFLPAVKLLPIMGGAAFLFGLGGILNTSIYAMRKPLVSRNITILTLVIFLSLSIPLSMWLAAMGMAIAYLISVSIFCISSAIYLKRFIKLSLDWFSILKAAAATLVFSGILFGIDSLIPGTALKLIGVIVASVLYLAMLVPLRFYKKEDLKILWYLSQKSPIGKRVFSRIMGLLSKYV